MVYKNDKSLNYILFEEGLVNKTSGVYVYEYHLKDHLGNTRVAFQPNGGSTTTTQVAEYYPFGSTYSPLSPAGTNKYLYNGKEKQDDVLSSTALDEYDYGTRFYDPQIGRWMTLDSKADKYFQLSPFAYVADNPLKYIDPNGKEIIVPNINDRKEILKMINSTALGTFAFDNSGKLFLSKSSGDDSKYSAYYRDRLIEAIDVKYKINISFGNNYEDTQGNTRDVDSDAGGGVTVKSVLKLNKEIVGKEADVIISGNPLEGLKDTNGNPLKYDSMDILLHELLGHAIPYIVKSDTGDAIDNENKARDQIHKPKRAKDKKDGEDVEHTE